MINEQYVITLTPMPGGDRPGITRLRQLLKLARRACGLRCVRLARTDDPDVTAACAMRKVKTPR